MRTSTLTTLAIAASASAAATVSPACTAFLSTLEKSAGPIISCYKSTTLSGATLASFCSKNCPTVSPTTIIAFGEACPVELADTTSSVFSTYDAIYTFGPVTAAMCATDSVGKLALQSMSSTNLDFLGDPSIPDNSTASPGAITSVKDAAQAALTALKNSKNLVQSLNAAFMFIAPAAPAKQLCTEPTRAVLASFLAIENETPYAAGAGGLASSPLLGGQPALWQALTAKCGDGYMQSIEALAGSPQTSTSGAGILTAAGSFTVGLVVAFVL